MILNWTDIQADSFSKKYFKRLENTEEFNDVIQASTDLLCENAGEFIIVIFHIEPSLIYIYPCTESNLFDEIGKKITIQVKPFFEYFESIENRYYKDDEFYKVAHEKILKDFYALFQEGGKDILEAEGLKIDFYEYLSDVKDGILLNKFVP